MPINRTFYDNQSLHRETKIINVVFEGQGAADPVGAQLGTTVTRVGTGLYDVQLPGIGSVPLSSADITFPTISEGDEVRVQSFNTTTRTVRIQVLAQTLYESGVIPKVAADGAAINAFTSGVGAITSKLAQVVSLTTLPAAGLLSDNANYAVVQLESLVGGFWNPIAGSGYDTRTIPGGGTGDWTADTPFTTRFLTPISVGAEPSALRVDITKIGAGVVVPITDFSVELYTVRSRDLAVGEFLHMNIQTHP